MRTNFPAWLGKTFSACCDAILAILEQLVHVEVPDACRVEAENLRALVVIEMAHLALDGFRRMRPRTLMMRVVIGPQEIAHQVVLDREIEPDLVLLERCEAVGMEILAGQLLHFRKRPHVMFVI